MRGKYRGKHVAGNVEPEADAADEMTEEEKLEIRAKRRHTRNDVKDASERLRDSSGR